MPRRTEVDHGRTPPPPLRVRSVLAASSRTWRRELRSLTLLAAALELPLVLAEIALQVTPGLKALADEDVTATGALLAVVLYGSLSHHFLAGLLERVVGSERQGHPRPTLGEILRDLPWARLVVADLLLTTMVAVGLALFVVPGLVILTLFSITLPLVNLERAPVVASFVRSHHLVRGHVWRVGVIAMCAFVLPEVAIAACAGLTHHLTDDAILNAIGHGVPAIVLMPIAALPLVVLAFDLVDLDAHERGGDTG